MYSRLLLQDLDAHENHCMHQSIVNTCTTLTVPISITETTTYRADSALLTVQCQGLKAAC